MEKLLQKTVRHYQTVRRSFQQLTANVCNVYVKKKQTTVGWELVLILPLAKHTIDTKL